MLLCVRIDFPKNFIAVSAGMCIAPPGIHGDSVALDPGFHHGLAKRKEGLGRMSPQFDEE